MGFSFVHTRDTGMLRSNREPYPEHSGSFLRETQMVAIASSTNFLLLAQTERQKGMEEMHAFEDNLRHARGSASTLCVCLFTIMRLSYRACWLRVIFSKRHRRPSIIYLSKFIIDCIRRMYNYHIYARRFGHRARVELQRGSAVIECRSLNFDLSISFYLLDIVIREL